MRLQDLLGDLRRAADSVKPIDGDAALAALAADAYACCVTWFGPPPDPDWRLVFQEGWMTFCTHSAIRRRYVITLSPQARADRRQLCTDVGHEMYHRVTERRHTLREPWLDEMMASLASLWFLRQCRLGDQAERIIHRATGTTRRLAVPSARAYRRPRGLAGRLRLLRGPDYPPGFGHDVVRLGVALAKVVGWQAMCRFASTHTLDQWLASLPRDERPQARCLLGLASGPAPIPGQARAAVSYAYALGAVGEPEAGIACCRRALEIEPTLCDAWHRLAALLYAAGRIDEAIQAWERCHELQPDSAAYVHNLASAHDRIGEGEAAVALYRQAAELDPRDARSRFALGCALERLGHDAEAREAYQEAARLDPETYSAAAQSETNRPAEPEGTWPSG